MTLAIFVWTASDIIGLILLVLAVLCLLPIVAIVVASIIHDKIRDWWWRRQDLRNRKRSSEKSRE